MSFKVKDNEFNRHWYGNLIGIRFKNPPGYVCVEIVDQKEDYKDVKEYERCITA